MRGKGRERAWEQEGEGVMGVAGVGPTLLQQGWVGRCTDFELHLLFLWSGVCVFVASQPHNVARTNTHTLTHARTNVRTHARAHARMHTHARTHARTHACTHASTHACMPAQTVRHTLCFIGTHNGHETFLDEFEALILHQHRLTDGCATTYPHDTCICVT